MDYEVFAADNCANPKPVKGSFTYVYTVTFADEGPIPGLSLDNLRVLIGNAAYVVDTGYLTGGPGVAPTSVTVSTAPANGVVADFAPGALALGDTSLPIFIISPYQPGAGTVNLQVSFLTGAGAALVPQALPQACPCTTSYWGLRITGWPFFLLDFPGAQLEQVKQRAVELSGGFFSSKTDLVNALLYPGLLDVKKKAKRELAALLLNVAAGELFPANTKCRLFLGTELDQDGDGTAEARRRAIGAIEQRDPGRRSVLAARRALHGRADQQRSGCGRDGALPLVVERPGSEGGMADRRVFAAGAAAGLAAAGAFWLGSALWARWSAPQPPQIARGEHVPAARGREPAARSAPRLRPPSRRRRDAGRAGARAERAVRRRAPARAPGVRQARGRAAQPRAAPGPGRLGRGPRRARGPATGARSCSRSRRANPTRASRRSRATSARRTSTRRSSRSASTTTPAAAIGAAPGRQRAGRARTPRGRGAAQSRPRTWTSCACAGATSRLAQTPRSAARSQRHAAAGVGDMRNIAPRILRSRIERLRSHRPA